MSADSILEPSVDEKTSTSEGFIDFTKQWIEGTYLSWFGEKKSSYSVKDAFKKREIIGSNDIDNMKWAGREAEGNAFRQGGFKVSEGNI